MGENVNEIIIEKIEKSEYDENVKKFLIESIRQEFLNYKLQRWNYTNTYEKNIKKFSKNYTGKKIEN